MEMSWSDSFDDESTFMGFSWTSESETQYNSPRTTTCRLLDDTASSCESVNKPTQSNPWDSSAHLNNHVDNEPRPMPDDISQKLANILIEGLKKADLKELPLMEELAESFYTIIKSLGGDFFALKVAVDPIFELGRTYKSMKEGLLLEVDEKKFMELNLKELHAVAGKIEANIKPLENVVRQKEADIEKTEHMMADLKLKLIFLEEKKKEQEKEFSDSHNRLRSEVKILNTALMIEHKLSTELKEVKSTSLKAKTLELVEAMISKMVSRLEGI